MQEVFRYKMGVLYNTDNLKSDTRRMLVYGGISTLLALSIVAMVALYRSNNTPACLPSNNIPKITSRLLASDDGTALAIMEGYVELLDVNGTSYLPLDFNTLTLEDNYNRYNLVRLAGECVTIEINYTVDLHYRSYKGLDVLIKDGRKPTMKVAKKICDLSKSFNMTQSKFRRYSCRQTRVHSCKAKEGTFRYFGEQPHFNGHKANLVLSRFELDTEANPVKTFEGEFSVGPLDDSCNEWSGR